MADLNALRQSVVYEMTTPGLDQGNAKLDKLGQTTARAAQQAELLSRQTTLQEQAITRVGSKLDAYTRALDPVAKALAQVERGERLLAAARAQGQTVSAAQLAAVDKARATYEKLSAAQNDNVKAIGLQRYELINLSRQIQDIGVSLASGQSPFTVLVQQGTQVADIFANSQTGVGGALRSVASGLAGMVTPARVAGASIAGAAAVSIAALIKWKSAQDEIAQSLAGIGRGTGLTAGGANAIALGAAGGSLSIRASQSLTAGYIGAGVDRAALGGLASATPEFARKFGLSFDEASKELAQAFADPAKGAEELARKYGLVTFEQERHVKQLAAVGDRSGAATELLGDLRIALDRIADRQSPFSQLIDRLGIAASNYISRAGQEIADTNAGPLQSFNKSFADFFGIKGASQLARESATESARAEAEAARLEADRNARRKDELDRLREDAAFAVREAQARTFAEREAVATQAAYTKTLRETNDAQKAAIAAERERALMVAEATRKVEDFARKSADTRAGYGLSPYERGRQAIINEGRDLLDGLPNGKTAASVAFDTVAASATRAAASLDKITGVASGYTLNRDGRSGLGGLISLDQWKTPAGLNMEAARRAISAIESGGNYRATANAGKGRVALGRYQILNTNLPRYAPGLSPSQFLNNPAAQDSAFDAMFGDLFRRYGNVSDAASAYFTGRPLARGANASDAFGMTGRAYVDKFLRNYTGAAPSRGLGVIDISRPAAAQDNAPQVDLRARAQAEIEKNLAAYDRESRQAPLRAADDALRERTTLLDAQAASFGKAASQIEYYNERARLMNEYARAGVTVTAELSAEIDKRALAASNAAAAEEALAMRQRELQQTMEDVRGLADTGLTSFVDGLHQGKSASDALRDSLRQVLAQLERMAIRSLLDGLFGSQGQQGGGGLLGGLLSGAVSGGGSSGGGGILGSLLGGLFKFADGGMVSLAHLPRYASGGALAPDGGFPIMAHPGEIILNRAQQAAVASGLQGPKVTINNNAPGVAVTPQITPEEIIFHIDSRIDANNRRLPGVMSDSAARSW